MDVLVLSRNHACVHNVEELPRTSSFHERRLLLRVVSCGILSVGVLAATLAAQASEADCQKASTRLQEGALVRQLFVVHGPLASKHGIKGRSEDGGDDLYSRVNQSFQECTARLGLGGPGGQEAEAAMGTNPRTCELDTQRSRPPGGADAVIWDAEKAHEEVHRATCCRMNGAEQSDGFRSCPSQYMADGGPPSPFEQTMFDSPMFYAAEEIDAYEVFLSHLGAWFHDNCKQSGMAPLPVQHSIPMSAKCGENAETSFEMKGLESGTLNYVLDQQSDWLQAEPSFGEIRSGSSTEVNLKATCFCPCGEPKQQQAFLNVFDSVKDVCTPMSTLSVTLDCEDPPDCGSSSGDPHLRTLDRVGYSFQGVGEYVLSRAPGFEVHVRQQPYGIGRQVSYNTAVAAKLGGDIVSLYLENKLPRLVVNGRQTELVSGLSLDLEHGGRVKREDRTYSFFGPGGYLVWARLAVRSMSIRVGVPPGVKTEGLLGDHDGEKQNDLRTAGGVVLSLPVEFEDFYRDFGDSWRVTAATSLFSYQEGQSTETFTDRTFPDSPARLEDLGPDARKRAEAVCQGAGVQDPLSFEECVLDVGITGDEEFAQMAAGQGASEMRVELQEPPDPERRVQADPDLDEDGVTASIEAPTQAASGSRITVSWQGPDEQNDYLAIARPEELRYVRYTYTRKGNPLELQVPDEPGVYELRYVLRRSRKILATRPIEITEVTASLVAPDRVASGSQIEISWSGPDNYGDYLAVARPGDPEGRYVNYTYARRGNPLTVRAPDEPGVYELRYVQHQSRNTLAARAIEVTAVSASIEVPRQVTAGASFELSWEGPDNQNDYLCISRPEDRPGKYDNYVYTRRGRTVQLTAPIDPGSYEIRYIQTQSKNVLERVAIQVVAPVVTLVAPRTVSAGEEFHVTWSGPDGPRDYIGISRAGDSYNEREAYTYTRRGNPITLKAPESPGTYQLRYVSASGKRVLAEKEIVVR